MHRLKYSICVFSFADCFILNEKSSFVCVCVIVIAATTSKLPYPTPQLKRFQITIEFHLVLRFWPIPLLKKKKSPYHRHAILGFILGAPDHMIPVGRGLLPAVFWCWQKEAVRATRKRTHTLEDTGCSSHAHRTWSLQKPLSKVNIWIWGMPHTWGIGGRRVSTRFQLSLCADVRHISPLMQSSRMMWHRLNTIFAFYRRKMKRQW